MQNKDEKLYLQAKEAYYNGNPIMTDAEFDALEERLKQAKSSVVSNVGSWDRRAKAKHPTRMLSLSKIQADKQTGEPPVEEFKKWVDKTVEKIKNSKKYKDTPKEKQFIEIEYTQKLDGNAINVVYENGTVKGAYSRGDGTYGRDYLPKLKDYGQIPQTIVWKQDSIIEVRCEAVIAKDIFERKYSKEFSNERNYVAGILNSDDATPEQLSEIDLVPVEVRGSNGDETFTNRMIELCAGFGFKCYNELIRHIVPVDKNTDTIAEFKKAFSHYERLKENGKYRVDGMVAKINEIWRSVLGENEHDPNWGLAIKFKPEDCITEVVGFTFEMGKTGEFTPVALLAPVDLDGSVVSKASAYNYRFIEENNLNVGSLVTLVKSGDIIPQIVNVINDMGEPYDVVHKEDCPYCGSPLIVKEGVHIYCPNEHCEGLALKKFINAMDALDVFGCGDAMCEQLFYNISSDPFYYLNWKENLLFVFEHAGLTGKNYLKFIDEVKKKTSITLETVIAMMSLDGLSNNGKTIKEIAKKIAGEPYNFKGLEKKCVEGWERGEEKREWLETIVLALKTHEIDVVYPEHQEPSDNVVELTKITMTGSPKPYGYATKAVFVKHLEEIGWRVEEVDVKKCDILFTDNLDSITGKMKTAHELGKEIRNYGDV